MNWYGDKTDSGMNILRDRLKDVHHNLFDLNILLA